MDLKVYVDADSIPLKHRSIIIKRALKSRFTCVFVADRPLSDVLEAIEADTAALRSPHRNEMDKRSLRKIRSNISFVLVESGKDSADNYIAQCAGADVICISHDIPLCARVVSSGGISLDDRGGVYDKGNIRERLSIRNTMSILREEGVHAEKQRRMDQRTLEEFANSFDKLLSRIGF